MPTPIHTPDPSALARWRVWAGADLPDVPPHETTYLPTRPAFLPMDADVPTRRDDAHLLDLPDGRLGVVAPRREADAVLDEADSDLAQVLVARVDEHRPVGALLALLPAAERMALETCTRYRLPEPIRHADRSSRAAAREIQGTR